MNSPFFSLSSVDFAKGFVVFVLAAVFSTLAQWFNMPGFDYASFQWDELLKVAVMAAVTYLSKNLFSTQDGKFAGIL